MKQLLCTLVLLFVASSQSIYAQKTSEEYSKMKYRDFIPIEPIQFNTDVEVTDVEGNVEEMYIRTLSKDQMQAFLTNETVLVSVGEVDKEGNLVYGPSRISKKNTQYIVTMDYIKFATSEIRDEGDINGEACVGVGLRIIINISSRADDVNLGDLFAIGVAVSDKQVYGSLRMEAIGIHDPEITAAIPLPSEISAAAIQSVMHTMSTIKYKIYDEKQN